MLLIITLLIIFIICISIYFIDSNYWHTDWLEITGIILGTVVGLALFFAILIAFISQCMAPYEQAKFVTKYSTLRNKVEHINEYNICEVKEDVDEWNSKLLYEYYAQQSPWISVYHTYKLDDVDYLEVK